MDITVYFHLHYITFVSLGRIIASELENGKPLTRPRPINYKRRTLLQTQKYLENVDGKYCARY